MAIEKFIRDRFPAHPDHPGQHSHRQRLDSAVSKVKSFFQDPPTVGGFHPEDHVPQDQEIVLFFPERNLPDVLED